MSILQAASIASGLINQQQLEYCLRVAKHRHNQQGVAVDSPISDRMLADILIEQEVVTPYQADQLLAGRTKLSLGPYIVTDWIGQGGMGQVFKAVHEVMGRVCAVKVLPLARATQMSRQNFLREIRMQASLDCPFLVRAFDAGQDGNVHYLVTEYVPGMDLRRLVKSRGALPVPQAAKIIMQAALGLDYAHSKGLVHRDVKPGNILVTPEGDAKVSDVGLAGFANDLMNDPRAGKIVGTTDYLSPEQIRTPLDIQPASDIYSLGCTLYYALCGKVPFPGGDTKSKLRRHLEETPWHPRKFAPDVPEDFVDIIADMMEKDATKRIASAAQVAARLEPWVSDDQSVGSVGLSRSPWMAPPPPSHDESDSEVFDRGNLSSEYQGSTDGSVVDTLAHAPPVPGDSAMFAESPGLGLTPDSRSSSLSNSLSSSMSGSISSASTSGSGATSSTPTTTSNGSSTAMVIALTVAIVVPPALLLGAILGFIIASR